MSVLLYDEDIVEEEAFMAWREELLEEVPGKVSVVFGCVSSALCSAVFRPETQYRGRAKL